MVIVNRYNTGLAFFKGRSICFSCNVQLQKKDLFPLFSFVLLKGRCRHCKSKIPFQDFFFEVLMGALSLLAAFKAGLFNTDLSSVFSDSYFLIHFLQYLLITAIFAVILLIAVYDLKHFIIPDSFLVSLFVLAFLYISFFVFSDFSLINAFFFIIKHLLSGVVLALPFLLIFVISKGRWLGFGDIKYMLVIGFFLGLAQGLSAIVLSFWIGATFSLLAILLKKIIPYINLPLMRNNLTIKSEIPFGPFLSLGVIISFYFNVDLFQIHSLFGFF